MAHSKPQRNWLMIGGIVGAVLLFAALYFFLFVFDDMGSGSNEAAGTGVEASEGADPVQMFTTDEVNIRDQPTTVDSMIIGKLPRGSAVTGVLKLGEDAATGDWLQLVDGKGYIAARNLSDVELPEIARDLGDRAWTSDARIDIYGPGSDGELIESAGEGTKLILSGLTADGRLEVKLADGRIGYIADGEAVVARLGGKPVSIAFNPATCAFGPELSAEFEKLSARVRAQWEALESREYPDDAARDKAMAAAEGKSSYVRLARSFEGLSLTAIALHYEAQSLYFADPPAKVIEAFRAKGFRLDRNGNFPSTELYAAITPTRGEGAAYGKSELGCGV